MAGRRKKSAAPPGSFKAPAKKAAFVIGIIGIVLALVCLIGSIVYRDKVDAESEYVLEPIFILICVLPIVAYWKTTHRLYLPFLVVNVILILLKILYIAIAIIILEKPAKKLEHRKHKPRIVPIVIVTIVTLFFNVLAQLVVHRAYKFAKFENAHPKVFGAQRKVTQA